MPELDKRKKYAKARTELKSFNSGEGFDKLKTFQESLDRFDKIEKEKKKAKLSQMWKSLNQGQGGPPSNKSVVPPAAPTASKKKIKIKFG